MRALRHTSLLSALVMLPLLCACTSDKIYSLSSQPPFSEFSHKPTTLKRDVLIVESFTDHYVMWYPNEWAEFSQRHPYETASDRTILVPAGTEVKVEGTSYEILD